MFQYTAVEVHVLKQRIRVTPKSEIIVPAFDLAIPSVRCTYLVINTADQAQNIFINQLQFGISEDTIFGWSHMHINDAIFCRDAQ